MSAVQERTPKQVQAAIKKTVEKQKKQLENGEVFNNTPNSNGGQRQSLNTPYERTESNEEEDDVEVIDEMEQPQENEKTDLALIVDSVFGQSTPESNGLTNGAGFVSPGYHTPEVSDLEKEAISEFKQPLNAPVQNGTMLHKIVRPVCIFLRRGVAWAPLVCMKEFDLINGQESLSRGDRRAAGAFKEFDRNKGYIKCVDLGECMRMVGYMPTEMELIELSQQIIGGKIEFEDFVELMGPKMIAETADMIGLKELKYAFKQFDTNGDGQISVIELREAMKKMMNEQLHPKDIDDIIQDVDLNGDGQVDFEEFVRMMSR